MAHTILIVDDDPEIGRLLTQILEDEGYRVAYVESGAAGLTYLASTPPDLVLLDYLMPGMNGAAFVQEAERQELRDSIPLILVSASDAVHARAQAARADDAVGKPFAIAELLTVIARHLPPAVSPSA